jgi:hypothetical protein
VPAGLGAYAEISTATVDRCHNRRAQGRTNNHTKPRALSNATSPITQTLSTFTDDTDATGVDLWSVKD